jgi:hypothetical protein
MLPGDLLTLEGYAVAECSYDGLTLTKEGMEDMVVFGLGPVSYWNSFDPAVPRPSTGDVVTVEYKPVTFGDVVKNILFSLAYEDGIKIQLRDPATGCPLWR